MSGSLGDPGIEALVEAFRRADPPTRAELQAACDREDRLALRSYAQRCAEAGLRGGGREPIERGLVALAFEAGVPDWRDTTILLSLLHDAATRAALDASALFLSVADATEHELPRELRYADVLGPELLRSFARRPLELQTIAVMGEIVVETEDGPAYRQVPWSSPRA